jgi:hypothetical protein
MSWLSEKQNTVVPVGNDWFVDGGFNKGNNSNVGVVFGVEDVANGFGVDVCLACEFTVGPSFSLERGGEVGGHRFFVPGRNIDVGVGQGVLCCFACGNGLFGELRSLLFRHSRTLPGRVDELALRKLSYPLSTMLGMSEGRISELVEHSILLLDAAGLTAQSQRRIGTDLRRLGRFLGAHDLTNVSEVRASHVDLFVIAPARNLTAPAISTQRNRRLAARFLYRAAAHVHPGVVDFSSSTVVLRRILDDSARPLSAAEIVLCRQASEATLHPTRLPALLALAEATATTGELPKIRVTDVDLDAGTVTLPGGKATVPRIGHLTQWGVTAVADRVRTANRGPTGLIAY